MNNICNEKLRLITQALVYMLEKLQKEICSKIVLSLEGGYDLGQIASVSEALFRCLKGESFPNSATQTQLTNQTRFSDIFGIPSKIHKMLMKSIRIWAREWPILNDSKLIERCSKYIPKGPKSTQVVAGHFDSIRIYGSTVFKNLQKDSVHNEAYVYATLKLKFPNLLPFVPTFLGLVKDPSASLDLETCLSDPHGLNSKWVRSFPEFPELALLQSFQRQDPKRSKLQGRFVCQKVYLQPIKEQRLLQIQQRMAPHWMAMGNLIPDDSFSIIDLKIALANHNPDFVDTPEDHKLSFSGDEKILRIGGMVIKSCESQVIYKSYFHLHYFRLGVQKRFLRRFFSTNDSPKSLDIAAVKDCIKTLIAIKEALEQEGIFFHNSSLLILYSAKHRKCIVKLIDLCYYPRNLEDWNKISGLLTMIDVLSEMVKQHGI